MNITDYLHIETEKRFERLEFTQFDYLSVEPPTWTIILSYIVTIIVCIVISSFIVNNEIDAEVESDSKFNITDLFKKIKNKFQWKK